MSKTKSATPSWLFFSLVVFFRFILSIFYRNIQIRGRQHIPENEAVIFTGMHINGLVDPFLVAIACPRQTSFVCKATLLQLPVLGWMLKKLHCVPVHRRVDIASPLQDTAESSNQLDNDAAFQGMHECLRQKGALVIFPEGISHNESDIQELKTGFARAAIGALRSCETSEARKLLRVSIVPVGINYLDKTRFQSDVFIEFGKPIVVTQDQVQCAEQENTMKKFIHHLRDTLHEHLASVTLVAPSWTHIRLLSLARRLYMEDDVAESPELYVTTMRHFIRRWEELNTDKNEQAMQLMHDLKSYDSQLQVLSLRDEDVVTTSAYWAARLLRTLFLLCIVLPVALPGLVLQTPVLLVGWWAGWRFSYGYDDQVASFKILGGFVAAIMESAMVFFVLYAMLGLETALFLMPVFVACLFLNSYLYLALSELNLLLKRGCIRLQRIRQHRAELKRQIINFVAVHDTDNLLAPSLRPLSFAKTTSQTLTANPISS